MLRSFLTFTFSVIILLSHAQDNALTVKDYQQAESLMGYNTQKYVDRGNVNANWIADDKFWYRVLTPQGSEFIIVDAAKGTRTQPLISKNSQRLFHQLREETIQQPCCRSNPSLIQMMAIRSCFVQ